MLINDKITTIDRIVLFIAALASHTAVELSKQCGSTKASEYAFSYAKRSPLLPLALCVQEFISVITETLFMCMRSMKLVVFVRCSTVFCKFKWICGCFCVRHFVFDHWSNVERLTLILFFFQLHFYAEGRSWCLLLAYILYRLHLFLSTFQSRMRDTYIYLHTHF